MKANRKSLSIRVHDQSASTQRSCFQTEVVPRMVYEGRALYARYARFLGFGPEEAHVAKTRIEEIENFIRHELEEGNRLDFPLVTFYPKLSAALPTRDADPEEAGLHLRGAVKGRHALASSLNNYLIAENPVTPLTIRLYAVYPEGDELRDSEGVILPGRIMNAWCTHVTIDPSCSDESIWLEKPIKRSNQTHTPIARCEYLGPGNDYLKFRLCESVKPGSYMLCIGTRAGMGPTYKLRVARHPVRVC